jgi:ssDNA-binding Zn-finger/Zn-ribbon topoisomerase 1
MRRALVDGAKAEAQPKLRGECTGCGGEMVAKCGRVKVWHWAHKGAPPCDPWWENETEWHREWKDRFAYYDRDKKRGIVGPIYKSAVVEDCIAGREIRKLFRKADDLLAATGL